MDRNVTDSKLTTKWDNKLCFFPKNKDVTYKDFVTSHPKVACGKGYKLGNLCINGSKDHIDFLELLDDVESCCVGLIAEKLGCSPGNALHLFNQELKRTENYDMLLWFM